MIIPHLLKILPVQAENVKLINYLCMDKKTWKRKTKHKHSKGTCGNKDCHICHSDKVLKMPDRQLQRANSKLKNQYNGD